jgi:hypothetical protein
MITIPTDIVFAGAYPSGVKQNTPQMLMPAGAQPFLQWIQNTCVADLNTGSTNHSFYLGDMWAAALNSYQHLYRCDRRAQPARLVIADRSFRSLGSKVVRPFRGSARSAAPRPKLLRADVPEVIAVRRSLRSMRCRPSLAAPATASPQGREPPRLTRRKTRPRVSVRSFVGHDDRNPVLEPLGIEDLLP